MRIVNQRSVCTVITTFGLWTSAASAAIEEDITRLHETPTTIGIATGHTVPLNLAPAVATVITAEELDAIGATTLSEALATVPGINVLYRSGSDHFIFRGIRADSNFNPDWSLMIDGIPQNDVLLGNQRQHIGNIPLQTIDRIEVIRGPGSALYGADAFAGVVNIITKQPKDVTGSEARVRVGTFDTREGRYQQHNEFLGYSSLLSLQVRETDDYRPFIEQDAQTFWDHRFGTNVSLAPNHVETWKNEYSLNWDLQKGPWRTRYRHRTLQYADSFSGALDPGGWFSAALNSLDLMYDRPDFSKNWGVKSRIAWFGYQADSHNTRGYPPGAFSGTFPDGLYDIFGYSENRSYADISGLYQGVRNHVMLLGAGAMRNRVFDIHESRNYRLSPSGFPLPLGQIVELASEDAFAPSKSRDVYFTYAQDEWSFARDWTLTSGLRYDHYSDFGSSTNPRLALVWATLSDLTTKLLVGQAFRAPTFLDLDGRNNPSVIGNPNLNPEKITTYEISFDYQPSVRFRTGLNVFRHTIDDKIRAVTILIESQNENAGKQRGQGSEWEWRWDVSDNLTLNGWYAWQRNWEVDTGADPGYAAHNSANLRLDWKIQSNWKYNINATWIADRQRPSNDVRVPVADYSLVDTTLRYEPRNTQWSVALSIFNVFNREARDQSDSPGAFRSDFPLAARSVFAEIRYHPKW